MKGERYTLRFEEPAASAIRAMSPVKKGRLRAHLEVLEVNPRTRLSMNDRVRRESYAFEAMRERGYDIRVFKCSDFGRMRVFFFVNETESVVLIMEIVNRQSDEATYGPDAPHVIRLIENYNRFGDALGVVESRHVQ